MSLIAIELNDTGITVVREQHIELESPGYALLAPEQPIVGEAAYRQAHLKPRQINHRFWDQLSTDSLPLSVSYAHSHAELAYIHLESVWEEIGAGTEAVIFAVPSCFGKQQLGLLLGIAQELSIPVRGIVDTAIAGSHRPYPEHRLLYLDIHLHRMVLTSLEQGDNLARSRVENVCRSGLVSIEDAWANVVADAFVHATRFDPFLVAATEQTLYDHLPAWVDGLQSRSSMVVEMPAANNVYHTTLHREQLLRATHTSLEQIKHRIIGIIATEGPVALQLTHRLTRLPGLVDKLGQRQDCKIIPLEHGAAALGALRHAELIQSSQGDVPFVTQIPWHQTTPSAASPERTTPRSESSPRPTHVVYRGLAYPLGRQPFNVGRELPKERSGISLKGPPEGISRLHCSITVQGSELLIEDHSTYGTFVNGHKINQKAVLHAGDRVRIGTPGEELQLIALIQDHET
jgi:hypothetical protein